MAALTSGSGSSSPSHETTANELPFHLKMLLNNRSSNAGMQLGGGSAGRGGASRSSSGGDHAHAHSSSGPLNTYLLQQQQQQQLSSMVEEAAVREAGRTRWQAGLLVVAAMLGWLVALGGMSAMTQECYSQAGVSRCARGLQFQWWGVWFEFIVLLGVTIAAFRRTITQQAYSLLALTAVCTSVLMICARDVMADSAFAGLGISSTRNLNAAAAGFVILATFNCFLILLLGKAGSPAAAAYVASVHLHSTQVGFQHRSQDGQEMALGGGGGGAGRGLGEHMMPAGYDSFKNLPV